MRFIARDLMRFLFPPACPLCLAPLTDPGDDFCPRCQAGFIPLPAARCTICALPFVASRGSSHLCADCLRQPPAYTRVYAWGLYSDQLRHAVQQFKFKRKISLDRSLGRLMLLALPTDLPYDLIVPVPLHRQRLRQRSYNQALLLAREIAGHRGGEVEKKLLRKVRETVPQHDLSACARKSNLAGAFQLTRELSGQKVLLVDDVMTTGATVDMCSRVLLRGGAAEVIVAVLARAASGNGFP